MDAARDAHAGRPAPHPCGWPISTALRIHPLQDNVLLRATLPALFGDKATHTLAALQRYVSAMSGMNKSAAFHAIFDFLTNRVGKRVWIEKTGGSLRYVDHLLGLWPDARLIVLVRDGRQCVCQWPVTSNT